MLERIEYTVARIDGDYAWLIQSQAYQEKCVARALLPDNIREGSIVVYEMLEYTLVHI